GAVGDLGGGQAGHVGVEALRVEGLRIGVGDDEALGKALVGDPDGHARPWTGGAVPAAVVIVAAGGRDHERRGEQGAEQGRGASSEPWGHVPSCRVTGRRLVRRPRGVATRSAAPNVSSASTARMVTGMAPARSTSSWPLARPLWTITPRPPAPTRPASAAVATIWTAEMRTPAKIRGMASGASTR